MITKLIDMQKLLRKGKALSYKVGSLAMQGLMNIGKSKAKLEAEQNYYQCIFDIFDEIVS